MEDLIKHSLNLQGINQLYFALLITSTEVMASSCLYYINGLDDSGESCGYYLFSRFLNRWSSTTTHIYIYKYGNTVFT